jgi:hypothetical protein
MKKTTTKKVQRAARKKHVIAIKEPVAVITIHDPEPVLEVIVHDPTLLERTMAWLKENFS